MSARKRRLGASLCSALTIVLLDNYLLYSDSNRPPPFWTTYWILSTICFLHSVSLSLVVFSSKTAFPYGYLALTPSVPLMQMFSLVGKPKGESVNHLETLLDAFPHIQVLICLITCFESFFFFFNPSLVSRGLHALWSLLHSAHPFKYIRRLLLHIPCHILNKQKGYFHKQSSQTFWNVKLWQHCSWIQLGLNCKCKIQQSYSDSNYDCEELTHCYLCPHVL